MKAIHIFGLFVIIAIPLMFWLACKLDRSVKHPCETCCYFKRNCTREPCIYCENGSEWVKSDTEGQELD